MSRRRRVSILAARDSFSRLVAAAEAGDEVEITRRGRPVARLTGIEPEHLSGARLAEVAKSCRVPTDRRRSAEQIAEDLRGERDSWD